MTEELKPLPCPFEEWFEDRWPGAKGNPFTNAFELVVLQIAKEAWDAALARSPAWRDTKEITEWKIEWETLKAENFRQHVQKVGVVQAMDDHVGLLLRILERYREAAQPAWRDIESAPRDGTLVDLWCIRTNEYGGVDERRYTNCKWGAPYNQILQKDDPEQWLGIKEMYATAVPTHWMPLPLPPEES